MFLQAKQPYAVISLPIAIVESDDGPAYIVKHSTTLLTLDELRAVYQGGWLNDQVKQHLSFGQILYSNTTASINLL